MRTTKIYTVMFTIMALSSHLMCNACTIFMGSSNGKVLVGNNEDFIDPNTYVWFLTSSENKFARIYFGYNPGLPQGGMNEKGLFFDYAATPPFIGKYYNKKEVYKGSLAELAMETCSNVNEVIELFEKFDRSYMTYQIMFADKKGNSVIIETDTILIKSANYQVATNFCQSLNEPNPYSIDRFMCADSMLKGTKNYSIDYFRSILDCTHQEINSPTQYSNIYDLTTGDVYIYLFHNYSDHCKFNLYEELKKGNHVYKLSDILRPSADYHDFIKNSHIPEYKIIQSDTLNYDKYTGVYEMVGFAPMKYYITSESNSLFLLMSGFNKYELFRISENSFTLKELNLSVSFKENEQNIVNEIDISMYGLVNYNAKKIGTNPAKKN